MTIYVDCPFSDCDDELEFNVYPINVGGLALQVDLVKQNCDCAVDVEDLEQIAADKYDPSDDEF